MVYNFKSQIQESSKSAIPLCINGTLNMFTDGEDEKDSCDRKPSENNLQINCVNSQRSVDKDATDKEEERNGTLQEEVCSLNRKNRALQKQLRKERQDHCREKQSFLNDSKKKIESMKKVNLEKLRKLEKEHQIQTEILVADIENLVAAVEEKDQKISQISTSNDYGAKNAEKLRSEIDILKAELAEQKQQLTDVTQVARASRKIVKQAEKESLKVLHQNELLKYRIEELVFAEEQMKGEYPFHQLQPRPSECDLRLSSDEDNNNNERENKLFVGSTDRIILPDKFKMESFFNAQSYLSF